MPQSSRSVAAHTNLPLEMMSQAEADEEILTLDVSDDLLERAGSIEPNAVTWVYCTHGYHYCEWPQ
jgi:hypothetical protein